MPRNDKRDDKTDLQRSDETRRLLTRNMDKNMYKMIHRKTLRKKSETTARFALCQRCTNCSQHSCRRTWRISRTTRPTITLATFRVNQNIVKREPKRKLICTEAMGCRITSSCTLLKRITRSTMKVWTRWTRSCPAWPCTWERSAGRQSASSVTRDKALPESRMNLREGQRSRKPFQHLVNQGKTESERKTIEESNIKNETTLEMTLRLWGRFKEDEMTTSAGSAEERNLKRKRGGIG